MPSNGFSFELPIGKVSKVNNHHKDSIYSINKLGSFKGTFAVASNPKELKQLSMSDADVVYDESKGNLYLNENGDRGGWGAKKIGGLLAKFAGKPNLSAAQFNGLSAYSSNGTKVENVKSIAAKIDSIDKLKKLDGTFAIAINSKELKKLLASDATVIYDKSKGKLYLNENGSEKGFGSKKAGGLLEKFEGKPDLNAELFSGLTAYQADDSDETTSEMDAVDSLTEEEVEETAAEIDQEDASNMDDVLESDEEDVSTTEDVQELDEEDASTTEDETEGSDDQCMESGTEGDDEIWGDFGIETAGEDKTYCLLDGNDTFWGYEDKAAGGGFLATFGANDTVYGGVGSDEIFGESGNDYLDASNDSNSDYLNGGEGRDTLVGYISSNIEGSGTGDRLVGGPGRDTFIIRHGDEGFDLSRDRTRPLSIYDFADMGDRIVFEDLRGELDLRYSGTTVGGDQKVELREIIEGRPHAIAYLYTNLFDIRGPYFLANGVVNIGIENGNEVVVKAPNAAVFSFEE